MEEIKESQPVSPLFTGGELKRLIIPLVIEQLLLMTVGLADTVMVTTAGEAAVSGISLVDSINLLLIQVFAALGTGGAVVVSQYLGRRDLDRACSAAKQLLYVITAVSLTLMALALLFRQSILAFLFGNIEPDVMENALVYFLLTALAYPFMSIYNVGAALFRSMGNSTVSMFNSLLVNMVNIAVNAILIYGFDMGAAGAGIGTLASRVVAAVIFMAMIRNPAHPVHIEGVLHFEFHWDTVKRILGISIPNGLENGMFQIGKLLVLSLITSFGTAATAANAIANSVASVVNVPGQCMGADDSRQAVAYTRKLMLAVYVSMGTLSALLFCFAGPLVALFHIGAAASVMAVEVLRWCAVFTATVWPLSFTLPNALRAAGDAKFTMVVSMLSMWIFRIGFSYLLAQFMDWGLLGVWVAMFIDWIVRALVFLIRFLRGRWKAKRVI